MLNIIINVPVGMLTWKKFWENKDNSCAIPLNPPEKTLLGIKKAFNPTTCTTELAKKMSIVSSTFRQLILIFFIAQHSTKFKLHHSLS
jgi:murein L,D-transpeptidase YafK